MGSNSRQDDSSLRARIEWVDVAKGIGIFLVVFGHNLGGLRESGITQYSWSWFIENSIYVFHMPLFFFLAGLFVTRSTHRTLHDYVINKASVIAYPYFVWSLLEGLLQLVASKYTNNHLSVWDLTKIVYQPIDQYWFLYVIFIMYITYWFVHRAGISDSVLIVGTALLHFYQVFGLNIVKWDVFDSFCYFSIYFALGVTAVKTSVFTSLRMLGGTRLLCLAVAGYTLIAAAAAIKIHNVPIVHTILSVSGIFSTISFAMAACLSPIWSFVSILGIYSLEIYVAHSIFASGVRIAMQKVFHYSGPMLHLVVGTVVGICIPILLAIWGPKAGLPYLFTWSRSRQSTEVSAATARLRVTSL